VKASGAATGLSARSTPKVFAWEIVPAIELITILNYWHHNRGFVHQRAHFSPTEVSNWTAARGAESAGLPGVAPVGAGMPRACPARAEVQSSR